MYKIGVIEKIIYQGYLTTSSCMNCSKTEENEIIITCQTFQLGPFFLPLIWFAWERNAIIRCNNCKKQYKIYELNGIIKEKADLVYLENKIPIQYYILTVLVILWVILNI